ncbi:MAG TPA: AMP-binding protein, partial [Prosthecobacter sp.]|nr:AMP-binding protein [Prosthecobacter sp.]
MLTGAFSRDFWSGNENYVAANAAAAQGLTAFAEASELRGMCFFQTSGSEGLPKWVALKKEAFLTSGRAVNAHFEITAHDRWLVALPLHHVGGFAIYARAALSGSPVFQWQAPKWNPADFVQVCEEQGITLVSLVPAQVHDLVREKLPCPPSLRAAIIGGGGMSQGLADQA